MFAMFGSQTPGQLRPTGRFSSHDVGARALGERTHDDFRLSFFRRHCQGGTGSGSAHNPRRALRASTSSRASTGAAEKGTGVKSRYDPTGASHF